MRNRSSVAGLASLVAVIVVAVLAAPAAALKTEVLLKSNPSGATVAELSEGYLGITNTSAVFKRWSVLTFVFTKEGYKEQRVTRKLKGRWMEISVDLEAIPGTPLIVNLEPAHATFRLLSMDGDVVWQGKSSDMNQLDDPIFEMPGAPQFIIEISAPGYQTLRERVQLEQYRKQTLSYALTGEKTVLEVRSDPLGATVAERSLGYLGTTPFRRPVELEDLIRRGLVLEPESGARVTLVLTASKSGYEDTVQEVTLDFAKPGTEVRMVLERAGRGGSR